MQRTKLLALAVGTLAVVAGATVFAFGSAEAATWHDYKGDLYPGHAYGLQVPMKAQAYEITLEGDLGAAAKLALFDPAGKALGFHALDASTPSVLIEKPTEGRHVVYVYELDAGALKLRVDAPLAPLTAGLQQMPLYEDRVVLSTSQAAAPLSLSKKQELASTPVFLTLLYEGSVKNLDATIASAKGDVVTIRGESGTAFSPGVWSHLSGERKSDAAKLEGLVFTVTAAAERFEGSLVLTSLGIDHKAPPAPEAAAPAAAPAPIVANGAFTPKEETPIAFHATSGALRITRAEPLVEKDRADDREHEHEDYWRGAVAIYRPDDSLLAYVTLSHREPNATVKLPESGEYVVYVHDAPEDGFLVQLVGASSMGAVRELATVKEVLEFDLSSGFRDSGTTFELARVPVALHAKLDKGTVGALSWVSIENAKGMVAGAQAFAKAPGVDFLDWSYAEPENFDAGEHTLRVQGILEGSLVLTSVSFVREDAPVLPEAPAEAETQSGLLGVLGL